MPGILTGRSSCEPAAPRGSDRSPRGRLHGTGRTDGIVVGRRPVMVAYVKTGCREYRREFANAVADYGLDAVERQAIGTGLTVYELSGSPEALDSLQAEFEAELTPWLADWHMPIDVRVPFAAPGAGPEMTRRRPPLMPGERNPAPVPSAGKPVKCPARPAPLKPWKA